MNSSENSEVLIQALSAELIHLQETTKQQIHELTQKLNVRSSIEEAYENDLHNLEQENITLRATISQLQLDLENEKNCKETLFVLEKSLAASDKSQEESQVDVDEDKSALQRLERELEICNSEKLILETELKEANNTVLNLKAQMQQNKDELKQEYENQISHLKSHFKSEQNEYEEEKECLQMQVVNLQSKLDALKEEHENMLASSNPAGDGFNGRGNSLFGELDDRRKRAEALVVQLQKALQQIKGQYAVKKKQMEESTRVLMDKLAARANPVNAEYMRVLQQQLESAKSELKVLRHKVELAQTSVVEDKKSARNVLQSFNINVPDSEHKDNDDAESQLLLMEVKHRIMEDEMLELSEKHFKIKSELQTAQAENSRLQYQLLMAKQEQDITSIGVDEESLLQISKITEES